MPTPSLAWISPPCLPLNHIPEVVESGVVVPDVAEETGVGEAAVVDWSAVMGVGEAAMVAWSTLHITHPTVSFQFQLIDSLNGEGQMEEEEEEQGEEEEG